MYASTKAKGICYVGLATQKHFKKNWKMDQIMANSNKHRKKQIALFLQKDQPKLPKLEM